MKRPFRLGSRRRFVGRPARGSLEQMKLRKLGYLVPALIEIVAVAILWAIGISPPAAIFLGLMAALFYVMVWENTKIDGMAKGLGGAGAIAAIVLIEWYRGVLH
jgi:hypothetical protein